MAAHAAAHDAQADPADFRLARDNLQVGHISRPRSDEENPVAITLSSHHAK
jgi:hypothetical protein